MIVKRLCMSIPTFLFAGYVFDLDGTIYLGDALLPGAAQTVRTLRAAGRRLVFLSNKPLASRADYAAKLTHLGIPTAPDEVINSSWVLARWLAQPTIWVRYRREAYVGTINRDLRVTMDRNLVCATAGGTDGMARTSPWQPVETQRLFPAPWPLSAVCRIASNGLPSCTG